MIGLRNIHAVALALPLLLGVLLLGGCDEADDRIKVGAKNFTESRILAEMIAALAEEQGVPVEGVVDYPTTQAILAALKAGDIDVYPDYNGTGLVMLGQNPISDGDEATRLVKELYEPLGLTWLSRFGFANNYGLALRADRAAELGVASISDLAARADELTIVIEDDFQRRPLDGLDALTDRYGMSFGGVEVVSLDDRGEIFDSLIDGEADIAEIYTTDGQIAEYGLVVLEDDLGFFPVYQAAPLARADALAKHPELGPALAALAGKIDAELMRALNGRVEIEGRSARAMARDALARLDLLDAGAVETQDPLLIAAEPSLAHNDESAPVLRAVQRVFTGRDVQFSTSATPLQEVGAGRARLALVGAEAFYDLSTPAPTRTDAFEAVAAVGQSVVHVVAGPGASGGLRDIGRLAVGPEGSSSSQIGRIIAGELGLEAEIVSLEADSAGLLQAVVDGAADAAVVMGPVGDSGLQAGIRTGSLKLLPLDGWNEGANLVRFPFLREARIAAGTYRGQFQPIDTLRTQLVLAGPAPREGDAVGDQGPAAVVVELKEIPASAVAALNDALPSNQLVDPALPIAASLAPKLPQPAAAMNPDPGISVLSLILVAFLIWLAWLLYRPEYR